MTERIWRVWDTRLALGLAVVVFGILLFLKNADSEFGYRLWSWWPVIFMILGLGMLLQPTRSRRWILGTVLFLLGLLILLSNLDLIRLRARDVWPILLILLGIAIVTRAVRTGRPALSGEYLDLSMIVGGGQFNYNAKSFRGGRITAILGGGTINLKETEMAADEAIIDALAIMGGIELIVPTEWEVVIQGTPILGGMENKSLRSGASGVAAKRLVVKGTTIMGGLEVKN